MRTNESMFYVGGTVKSLGNDNQYRGPELFAFNKSKISNYKNESVWENSNLWLEMSYPNGDPVDFRLTVNGLYNERPLYSYYQYPSRSDYVAKTNGTLKGQAKYGGFFIYGYEVADRTVYQKLYWTKNSGQTDLYYERGENYQGSTAVSDLRAYDAFTGELIFSSAESGIDIPGISSESYVKGDHIVLKYGGKYYEYDRNGNLVATHTLPDLNIPNTNENYRPVVTYQQNALGDIYVISELVSKSNSNARIATYLSKVNTDFTLVWTTKLQGTWSNATNSIGYAYGAVQTAFPHLVFNPIKQEVMVNTFSQNGLGVFNHYQRLSMTNGSLSIWDSALGNWSSQLTQFQVDWFGNYTKLSGATAFPGTLSADGWTSKPSDGYMYFFDNNGDRKSQSSTNGIMLWLNIMFGASTSYPQQGLYVGDGMYLSYNGYKDAYNDLPYQYVPVLTVGTPTTDPLIYDAFTLGQFMSEDKLKNAELAFKLALHQPKGNTDLAGMSFRMQNPLNRYAVETDGVKLYLSKYMRGSRTVLASQSFPVQPSQLYSFRIIMQGEAIKVYMDGVPYFEVTDNEYS
ncbi:hypothetical protein, partial [Paenibacillus sp. HB172176]|uniref:hypothetical protein n=1 Tax=Paenibacillus sp. HB172176 TaxID=2493690 RepID=UPI00143C3416